MTNHLKSLRVAFEEVFANSSYIALASALAVIAFLFAVWLPNIGLLTEVFGAASTPLETKLKLAWSFHQRRTSLWLGHSPKSGF